MQVIPVAAMRSIAPGWTPEQVPTRPARLQAEQVPKQAASQQTLSVQLPEPHSVPTAQAIPLTLSPDWQAPVPSQDCVPLQADSVAFGSGAPAFRLTQLPSLPGTLHPWQRPVQALLQQKPSTQRPDPQSAAA